MAGVTTRDAKGVPLTADDYDNNLETMISLHQGTSEPSPTYACMLWADTQNTLLKMRNTANDGWVTLGALNTNDAFGGISDLVEDTTPQLGGDLSTNSNDILFADNDKAIFGAGSDLQIYHDGSNSIINDNGTGSLKFQYGGTDGVVFDSSGNVGIGTSSPNGNGLLTINAPTNNSPQIVFSENDSAKWLIGHRHDGDHFRFYNLATSSEAMRIDSSGNVGIGTDSPSVPLHVQANASGNALILKGRNAAENAGWLTWTNYAGTTQAALYATSDNLIIATGSGFTERMRIDSSGRVGIGTSSPSQALHVNGSIQLENGTQLRFKDTGGTERTAVSMSSNDLNIGTSAGGNLKFINGSSYTERMRIDSSGNLIVGKTSTAIENEGLSILSTGRLIGTADSDDVLVLRRNTTDGDIINLRKDGTTVGSIGSAGGGTELYIGASTTNGNGLYFSNGNRLVPMKALSPSDNTQDCGHPSFRFDDVYATNGTIQTSDRNEKQDIEELSEAEQRVAVACKGLLRKYRWKDAVAEKGDDARIHFGIIAQDLQDAFAAEGLDAGRYAMFISSTWWETQTEVPAVEAVEAQDAVYEDVIIPAVEEVLDEEGNVVTEAQPERTEKRIVSEAVEAVEAKEAYIRTDTYDTAEEAPEGATERTRLGVRYPELLAFIIAAI